MKGKYNMGNWITPLSAELNMAISITFLEKTKDLPKNSVIIYDRFGNKILKSEVFMDMLAMTYIIVSVIGVVFFDMALH